MRCRRWTCEVPSAAPHGSARRPAPSCSLFTDPRSSGWDGSKWLPSHCAHTLVKAEWIRKLAPRLRELGPEPVHWGLRAQQDVGCVFRVAKSEVGPRFQARTSRCCG